MGVDRRGTIQVGRGLFVARYVAAEDAASPPHIRIAASPESEDHVELVLHPDREEAVLFRPGASLVVRATMSGVLEIEVEPSRANGSVAATVNVEPLTQGETSGTTSQPQTEPRGQPAADLRILGHIAGIGDVCVNANEWLAGPTAPSRIEGISIDWDGKPRGLDINYSVKTAQPLPISGRLVDVGSFAGTRGKAMPLTGVMFELSGTEAQHYQFVVEFLFLGAPVMRLSGPRIVASGPTGREPLVGLRVALEEREARSGREPLRSASGSPRSSGRVRVFRSQRKQE